MRGRVHARGLTITELLVVVSLLTILTSFLSPFVLSVKHAALARLCAHNMRQCYVGAQMYANDTFGRLPSCVELNITDNPIQSKDYSLNEQSWWFHKIAAKIYVAKNPDGTPLNNPVIMNPPATRPVPADQCVLRCPGSTDPYDQTRVRGSYAQVSGTDKDRVFDDNFGYNNFGFRYGGGKEASCALPNPYTLAWGARGLSYYYRTSGTNWGNIVGRLHFLNPSTKKCDCGTDNCPYLTLYCRLGDYAMVPEAARTLMMMDYAKADVAPRLNNDGVWGYRFRHDGRANAMFVDGHVDLYTQMSFLKDWMEPDHAKWGTTGASDPLTQRGRIHWAVLRP